MTPRLLSMALIGLMTLLPVTASAKDKTDLLGSFRKWDAFKLTATNGGVTCYMISTPTRMAPKGANRGKVYTTITHRPKMKIKNEVNVIVGYPFLLNKSVTATVDNRSFSMFTDGDGAWLRTPKEDSAMVAAMKRGNALVFRGTSKRGTATRDTYSLSGFTAAYNAITKACK